MLFYISVFVLKSEKKKNEEVILNGNFMNGNI